MQAVVPTGRSEPSPIVVDLDLRQADHSDLPRLIEFYRNNFSTGLPAPPVAALGRAMDEGRMLLVEARSAGPVLAASAVFDFSPPGWSTYVGELSGTCVTRELNGYGPMSFQRILLAARVLGHVALNSEVAAGSSSTLVTVVKADNAASIRNIEAAGFLPMQDKPDWMEYDEHAWHGSPVGTRWLYYFAADGTARQAFADLEAVGISGGIIELARSHRDTGRPERVRLRLRLADIEFAWRDLAAIAGGSPAGLSPPPATLLR